MVNEFKPNRINPSKISKLSLIAKTSVIKWMNISLTSMRSLLEDEIIPQLENELDFDPTPQHLWDDTGGEPPVTLDEMHTDAYNRKYNQ